MRKLFISGIALIVLFDAFASLLSNSFQIPYTWFWPISIFIYGTFGYVAVKKSNIRKNGAIVGAILGLTDTTIGWKISIWLNAFTTVGQIEPSSTATWVVTIIIGTLFATLIGFIGGLIRNKKNNE